MRRAASLLLASLLGTLPPATASGEEAWRQVPGGWVSGPVDWVASVPLEPAAMGGRIHGNLLIVSNLRSFSIYDVSNPVLPVPLSTTPLAAQTWNEQPQTNGKILLLTKNGALDIFDIQDPRAPRRLTTFADPRINHIWSCVLDCRYAYGGRGTILDLADPAAPRVVGDWTLTRPPEWFHTVREISPGIVLTGSAPMLLLDARNDAARPELLAQAGVEQTTPKRPFGPIGTLRSLVADVHWPLAGADRFVLASTETAESGECDEASGSFYSYDTQGWQASGRFTPVDEFAILDEGTFADGAPPAHVLGCSAYAFEPRPSYATTREVAVAWFENGMRLLRLDDAGRISEAGGFIAPGGVAVQPLWRTDEIVYLVDMQRGLEILRVERTLPGAQLTDAPGDANGTGTSARAASIDPADLIAMRLETTWIDIPVGEDGIRREPTGLRVRIRTRDVPRADGPSLTYGLAATLGPCAGAFTATLRGPLATDLDPPDRRVRWERTSASCPGGPGVTAPATWSASVDAASRELVLTMPFAGLTPGEAAVLGSGTALVGPSGSTALASAPAAAVLDRTATGDSWTIGSDVPPDVPCTRGCPES